MLEMVPYPLASDTRKYRKWLGAISYLTLGVASIAFLVGLLITFLVAMPLPFQLHDQSAPPADEVKASLENKLRILPLVAIGMFSPLTALVGVVFVNERTNRGIYLSIAALATLMPYAVFVLASDDRGDVEDAVAALGIFDSLIAFAIFVLIKERQTLHQTSQSA